MFRTVEVPLWLLVLILAFAGVTFASHFLFPSVRWFFRRRMERAVARLNQRLQQPIAPFKLLERHDRILRLIHDPQVLAAVVAHARANGVPETVAMEKARRYAREIVPSFSATVYFGFAVRAARWLSRRLYRVEVGASPRGDLRAADPDATVVFIMNHRSNMDYVLVTWLVSDRMTLSYAVGEWARVWPLTTLFRAMGAYFIRRKNLNPLYRKVLERYVQTSTAEGVAQAIFPEGGLSLDGRVGEPRLGILSWILAAGQQPGARDVVFVPVGLCYDRVLEDRLLTEARAAGTRRFRARPLVILRFVARMGWRMLRRRFGGFGAVGVSFGDPLSLRDWLAENPGATDPAGLPGALASRLMERVGRVIPVLPLPLVAAALDSAGQPLDRPRLVAAVADLRDRLAAADAVMKLPDLPAAGLVDRALVPLMARGIVQATPTGLAAAPGAADLLAFHAAPIRQLLDAVAASEAEIAQQPKSTGT